MRSHKKVVFKEKKSNWVYCSHSNVLIPLFLKPVNLWYFKLKLFGLTGTKLKVWNIKGLRHQGINNLSLWQEISSFRIPEYEQNWWCMKRDFENSRKSLAPTRERRKSKIFIWTFFILFLIHFYLMVLITCQKRWKRNKEFQILDKKNEKNYFLFFIFNFKIGKQQQWDKKDYKIFYKTIFRIRV